MCACVRACLPACVRGHDMRINEEHPISYIRGQHCVRVCVRACVRACVRVVCVSHTRSFAGTLDNVCHTPGHTRGHFRMSTYDQWLI